MKKWYLKSGDVKELFRWDEPEGCFASDRIMVDGCKVGYMYRESPDEENSLPDSGWRFIAGDESADYLDDDANVEFFALNTVANVDPEIIPHLSAPYGTAFFRDECGHFVEEPLVSPDA